MKPAPTLIDDLYRATFANATNPGWANNAAMRDKLRGANRFVLDEDMAVMLAELSTATFRKTQHGSAARHALIEQIRHGARAPFPLTWIEYPLRPCMTRIHDLLETEQRTAPGEIPEIEGWLIEQHPGVEAAFMLTVFSHDSHLADQ